MSFKKRRGNNEFFRHTIVGIHHQKSYNTRNTKISPSSRYITVQNGNPNTHKGIKSPRNGNTICKYKTIFLMT